MAPAELRAIEAAIRQTAAGMFAGYTHMAKSARLEIAEHHATQYIAAVRAASKQHNANRQQRLPMEG